jgi:GTP-binding protein Era
VRESLRLLRLRKKNAIEIIPDGSTRDASSDDALARVKESLHNLLEDPHVPASVRAQLAPEFRELEAMLDKLEHGHIHIAAFGRVGVGKSSLLNALLGENRFYVSALHGATQRPETATWRQNTGGHVVLYDTPGINEIDGKQREQLAHEVAARSDLVLFVVDGDLTDTELRALRLLANENRPLLLVLNKADRYTASERELLLSSLTAHVRGLVDARTVVTCAAAPSERVYVERDELGAEYEVKRRPPADVISLQEHLWDILEREGKTLAAINAGLFAGRLSDQVAARITEVKQALAQRVINNYCLGKGLAVAFNPVPITDLVAAAALDMAMVIHLSRVYGLPVTRSEAGRLVQVITTQIAALMGAVWAMHLLSSALKLSSAGLSTVLTASAQGAVGYYGTFVVGRAAAHYFAQGKSWGKGGAKRAVKEILDSIDRDSVLKQAREDIRAHLRRV